MSLIDQMRKARVDRGVTQAQLAARLRVRQSLISMVETGEMQASTDLLERIRAWLASGSGGRGEAPRGPRGNYRQRQTINR